MDDKKTIDQLDNKERLHLSILHGVKGICKIVEESSNPNVKFDRDAVTLIGEIVWRKLQEMASDLEHFAKHAKRTTIKPPDVLLLTRRNPALTDHLSKLVKVEEKRKRKSDGTVVTAAVPAEASDNVHIESNAESNDAAFNTENVKKNFYLGDDNMDTPFIVLSDDD